jgi:hypothetical protein
VYRADASDDELGFDDAIKKFDIRQIRDEQFAFSIYDNKITSKSHWPQFLGSGASPTPF